MFDSSITVNSIISELRNEVDVAAEIPDTAYIMWLNSMEQLLYSEIIKEQNEHIIENPVQCEIEVDSIEPKDGEAAVRFEDIYTIYADDVQLMKSTLVSGVIFSGCFYKLGNNIGYKTEKAPQRLRIIYFVRPALKVSGEENVSLPAEFIDLAKSKLRGEAYKLANEDGIAAKWLNDYNVLLENFKAWISARMPSFGM